MELDRAPYPTDAAGEWFGDRVRAGALSRTPASLVERSATRAGVMPPLHAHGDDVSYYILAGRLTFFVCDEIVDAGPADVVVVPADAAHTFRVETDGARWLVLARVSAAGAFEDFGRALAPPAPAWGNAEEAAAVTAIAVAAGIRVLGQPGALPARLAA